MMTRRPNAALLAASALLILLALLLGDAPTAAADEGCVKTGESAPYLDVYTIFIQPYFSPGVCTRALDGQLRRH